MKKPNRIDFFNILTTSSFDEWYEETIDENNCEKRCFLLLDYFTAIKKLYSYFYNSFAKEDIKKLFCDFKDKSMIVTVKYDAIIDEETIYEIEQYFIPDVDDNYKKFSTSVKDQEKDKTIKLIFKR